MRNKLIYLFLGLTVLSCAITKQELPRNSKYQIRHTKSIRYKIIKVDGQILSGEYFEYGEKYKDAVVFHNYYDQNGRMIGHEYLDEKNNLIKQRVVRPKGYADIYDYDGKGN